MAVADEDHIAWEKFIVSLDEKEKFLFTTAAPGPDAKPHLGMSLMVPLKAGVRSHLTRWLRTPYLRGHVTEGDVQATHLLGTKQHSKCLILLWCELSRKHRQDRLERLHLTNSRIMLLH